MPAVTIASEDTAHMGAALALASRGLGDTWPNPAVGCVIVRDGAVVARGWTQSGGRPHAEAEALARAGAAARGATVYVTLEPCSHHGHTPPCADALVAAGVVRVVTGTADPDPRVNGAGFARLKAAGIAYVDGVGAVPARALNRGFFLRVTQGRPMFTLKTATSLDSRIAMPSGESRWITGEAARQAAQVLRARHDAILIGSGTALADDPALTCRLDGYRGRPKVRIVLDRRLRLAPTSQLARTAREVPTWVLTTPGSAAVRGASFEDAGLTVVAIDSAPDDAAYIRAAAQALGARGLTRVLIEGGGQAAAAFLNAEMIDELAWFRADSALGAAARPAIGDLAIARLADAPRFRHRSTIAFDRDTLEMFDREAEKA